MKIILIQDFLHIKFHVTIFIGHENIIKGAEVKEDGTIYFTNLKSNKNFADGSNNAKGCIFQIAMQPKGNGAPAVTKIYLFYQHP